MKSILAIAAIAVLTGAARADWKDLKPGMDYQMAVRCAGMPLMQNHGKGGAEVWTFDNRGYIQFQSGRVAYWNAPKVPTVQWSALAQSTMPVIKALKRAGRNAVALKD